MSDRKNKSRRWKYSKPMFWGMVLILAALLLILDGVGIEFGAGITTWRIVVGVLLLGWLACEIVRLKFADIFFPLAFLFLVFRDPLAGLLNWNEDNIPKTWIIIVAAALLTTGFHVLFDHRKTVTVNGQEVYTDAVGSGKVGKETLYADAKSLSGFTISNHLGAVEFFLSNVEEYPGSGVITICDNLGLVTLHLPKDWNVVTQCSDNLGTISVPEHTSSGDKSITLDVHDNLGRIEVKFE